MGIELAKAFIRVRADSSKLKADLGGARKTVEENLRAAQQEAILAGGAVAAGIGAAFTAVAAKGIILAGQMEQLNISFRVMLGSAEKAKQVLQDLTEFAASTPFQFEGISKASRILLAFGFSQEELMGTLKSLGDVAAGTGKDFAELAVIYGQVKAAGRLMGQDLLQFINAGIPIIQVLAQQFGTTEAAIKEMVSAGQVSFKDVEKAFKSMSGEGGKFYNLMEEQSKSFLGIWSTLKDNLEKVMRTLGESLLPVAKGVAEVFLDLAKRAGNFLKIIQQQAPWLFKVFAALGLVVAGLIAYIAAMKLASIVTAFFMAIAGPGGWKKLGAAIVSAGLAVASMAAVTKEAAEEMDATGEGMSRAEKEVEKVVTGVENLGIKARSSFQTARKFGFDFLQQLREINEELQPPVDKLEEFQRAVEDANHRASMMRHRMPDAYKAAAMEAVKLTHELEKYKKLLKDAEDKKGFDSAAEAIQNLQDELFQAKTGVSDLTIAIKKLEQTQGVTPKQISQLIQMQRELEKIRKEEEAAEKRKKAAKEAEEKRKRVFENLKEAGKRLTESVRTPLEVLRSQIKEVFSLLGAGHISRETARRRLAQLREGISPERTMSGRAGFAGFGSQLQDLLIGKKSDIQREKMIGLLERANQNDQVIIREIGRNRVAVLD